MNVSVKFAWYDMWVGLFIDRKEWRLYVCPLPMLLITIQLPTDTRFSTFNRYVAQLERAEALGIPRYQIDKLWNEALYGERFTTRSRGSIRRFAQLIDNAASVAGRAPTGRGHE